MNLGFSIIHSWVKWRGNWCQLDFFLVSDITIYQIWQVVHSVRSAAIKFDRPHVYRFLMRSGLIILWDEGIDKIMNYPILRLDKPWQEKKGWGFLFLSHLQTDFLVGEEWETPWMRVKQDCWKRIPGISCGAFSFVHMRQDWSRIVVGSNVYP